MPINTRLQENPILQKKPENQRQHVQWMNEMAKWIGREIAKFGESIYLVDGTTLVNGLDEITGQLNSERNLKMSMVGNNASVQKTNPLSSIDAGATATIQIAAHSLATPTGDISYNSGTITGLAYGTSYVVYADDTSYAGGAVTYEASTDPFQVVAAVNRYYVGQITTIGSGPIGVTELTFSTTSPGIKIETPGGDIVVSLPSEDRTPGGAWGDQFTGLIP
jgi:hypothetical protein